MSTKTFVGRLKLLLEKRQIPVLQLVVRDQSLDSKLRVNEYITDFLSEITGNISDVEVVLVHYHELSFIGPQSVMDLIITFSVFGSSFEEIVSRLWHLDKLLRVPTNTIPLVVIKDLNDIFRLLGGKIREVEYLIRLLIKLNLPVLILNFQTKNKPLIDLPYYSIFRNLNIHNLILRPSID